MEKKRESRKKLGNFFILFFCFFFPFQEKQHKNEKNTFLPDHYLLRSSASDGLLSLSSAAVNRLFSQSSRLETQFITAVAEFAAVIRLMQ